MVKKRFSLFLIGAILVSILAGCAIDSEELDQTEEEVEIEDMETIEKIEIEDMAGRLISLPKKVDKVFANLPSGTIFLYSLNPDKMIGWNYDLSPGEKRFIDEKYHSLPNLGGVGKNVLNIEELLKLDPDVIVVMVEHVESSLEEVKELEEQTGKPVVYLDSDIYKLDEAYRIMGKILGEEKKAEELAKYCKETMTDVEDKVPLVKDEDRVRIYYAEGPDGLQTEPSNSSHGQLMDIVKGQNVAEVPVKGDMGKSEVSIEQLLKWNPEIIISWDDERGGYYSEIFKDPSWRDIEAVKNKKIYEIPNKPFNWFDRPPSVNRILGVRWIGNLLYPDIFDYDMKEEVKEFYHNFYHYQLSEEEVEELLENSTR